MKRAIPIILILTMLAGCGAAPEAEPAPAEVPAAPPGLTVESGGRSVEAERSTYDWNRALEDGMWEGISADCPHPLDILDQYPILETEGEQAVLVFEEEPDEISQLCFWQEEDFTNSRSSSEAGRVEDGAAVLEKGLCLYEVTAVWERENWGGTVNYVFQVRRK